MRAEKDKRYRERHPERIRAKNRKYYREHRAELLARQAARWQAKKAAAGKAAPTSRGNARKAKAAEARRPSGRPPEDPAVPQRVRHLGMGIYPAAVKCPHCHTAEHVFWHYHNFCQSEVVGHKMTLSGRMALHRTWQSDQFYLTCECEDCQRVTPWCKTRDDAIRIFNRKTCRVPRPEDGINSREGVWNGTTK